MYIKDAIKIAYSVLSLNLGVLWVTGKVISIQMGLRVVKCW